jgi:pimeloyl-ACP methyl ester carboxylesterase
MRAIRSQNGGDINDVRIPDARLHTMHGGGHLFLLEQPAEMAALVARCLAEQG